MVKLAEELGDPPTGSARVCEGATSSSSRNLPGPPASIDRELLRIEFIETGFLIIV